MSVTDPYEQLDQGYHALYNLDFARADNLFTRWESTNRRTRLVLRHARAAIFFRVQTRSQRRPE